MSGDRPLQTTVRQPVEAAGIALHAGARVRIGLGPAGPDEGIVFERRDLPGSPRVAARPDSVNGEALERRTELVGPGGATVATPEHLLAACLGLGLDNARVTLDGPELPIFDGSALPYTELIDQAGLEVLEVGRKVWRLKGPVTLARGDAEIVALPAERMQLAFFASLRHAGLENQAAVIDLAPEAFRRDVAPARTFCFYEEVEALRAAGLIRGGSLDCALVIRDGKPYEAEYRLPNELAAHKLLDLIGDFAILGRPVAALVTARGSGHALHHAFIRQLERELIE